MSYSAYSNPSRSAPSDRFPLINRRNIKANRYTQTLISEAMRVGLLPISTVDDIQMQVMGKLDVLMQEFRKKHGRDATEADAEAILHSIFYTLDRYLLEFHDPMYAIASVQTTDVEEMFAGGQKQLKAILCESVSLYVQIKRSRIVTENEAYNQTVSSDIRTFLDAYDYRFAAHERICVPSYPVMAEPSSTVGICYLRDYLRHLQTENRLMRLFESEERDLLFASHAQLYGKDAQKMQVNLFSRIIINALGAAMLGKYTGILTLTEEEVALLYQKLQRKTTRELEAMANEAVTTLLRDLRIEFPSDIAYVKTAGKRFASKLVAARNAHENAKLFVISDPLDLFRR